MLVSDFKILRPKYEVEQEQLLEWIAKAHSLIDPTLYEKLGEKLQNIGLSKETIMKRGTCVGDCLHERWDEMEIFGSAKSSLKQRMSVFQTVTDQAFQDFYSGGSLSPHLVHVTCTGYVAPSPAQKIVAQKQAKTIVTHAYHMGCYGAIPAIRMAMGFGETDIVHTELSSLHFNPDVHTTEQLIVQGLFADGLIKYSYGKADRGFEILAVNEEVIADSAHQMTWHVQEPGFFLSIGRDVPVLIARSIEGFVDGLFKKAGRSISERTNAYFAIHPGGPKIIQQTARMLGLEPEQYNHSLGILKNYGNMSSATLPHIWASVLDDRAIKNELVVSLAFGPGLTIAGALFRKCNG